MSDQEESLSSILSDAEPATDEKPAPAAAATSAAKEPEKPAEKEPVAAADAGREAPPQDTKPAEKPGKSPDSAFAEMRRRMERAEARNRELEAKQPKEAPPSVFDDEDKAITSRVDKAVAPLREKFFRQSVELARMRPGREATYAEAEEAFLGALESDPRLEAAWQASDNPGEYVYTVGMQIRELADVGGDFVKYREKVTGELRGQVTERDTRIKALEAEVAALKQAQADLETIPRSLNSKSSASAPKAEDIDDEPISKVARFGNH